MTSREFAAAVTVLIEDDDAYRRASKKDLVLVESILLVIAERAHAELARRERRTYGL